jgi:hypothetical protein
MNSYSNLTNESNHEFLLRMSGSTQSRWLPKNNISDVESASAAINCHDNEKAGSVTRCLAIDTVVFECHPQRAVVAVFQCGLKGKEQLLVGNG